MGQLINIDNGGTLTDICVIEGDRITRTKTLTTPYDLSECLFTGLIKASAAMYGEEDLQRLLLSTDHIRYSTTQGTNALVEGKGPRLGLIIGGTLGVDAIRENSPELFDRLVGNRIRSVDLAAPLAGQATLAVTQLGSEGANRVVVAIDRADRGRAECEIKRALLQAFPAHLLGALPILYSHEVGFDSDDPRRCWTALFNAFLHPAMERFLYAAEHKLKKSYAQKPLLIFRNDGGAARVAKTMAIKTYSSGPRGGADGSRTLADHYGIDRLISIDIGGTTSDLGLVENGIIRSHRHGKVHGVETSFPLADIVSIGVGGSSVLRPARGNIAVGPDSVGSAPGPACFGLGGTELTITDVVLCAGLLDPASFFGGELRLDQARALAAVNERIAGPLGIMTDEALDLAETAWAAAAAAGLRDYADIAPGTVLAAFGGAGPLLICRIAELIGIDRVLIPKYAAVFSAFGIGFSDIGHRYEALLDDAGPDVRERAEAQLRDQARRGMFAEGATLEDCRISIVEEDGVLALEAVRPITHAKLHGSFARPDAVAQASESRRVRFAEGWRDVPLYRVEAQAGAVSGRGPAVLEEAYFTCRIDTGWSFEINVAGDIMLTRETAS